jgi:hypothetical protein
MDAGDVPADHQGHIVIEGTGMGLFVVNSQLR